MRLSSETIHASTVARDGRAVLLIGPSGSGKSDLALQLIDRGFTLVSDDQTILSRGGGNLLASSPATIRGKLEVRGLGIVDVPSQDGVPVVLAVELSSSIERMPDDSRHRTFVDQPIPLVTIDARTPSAAAKVVLALDRVRATSAP